MNKLLKLYSGAAIACFLGITQASSAESIPENGFVVHEWGSLTTVQDDTGATLNGLNETRHDLPKWVYVWPKDIPLRRPTFIEKPILYFYSKQTPLSVQVGVRCPEGIFTQWWPQVSSIYPSKMDPNIPMKNGRIIWENVKLTNNFTGKLRDVSSHPWWPTARNTNSAVLEVSHWGLKKKVEHEKFLFYRGATKFQSPFKVTFENSNISVTNTSKKACSDVFIVYVQENTSCYAYFASLAAGENVIVSPLSQSKDQNRIKTSKDARSLFKKQLITQGLFEKEAEGMTSIWEGSYFNKHGLRVIHFCSANEIDTLMPLHIQPKPVDIKRVLAVRMECITPDTKRKINEWIEQLKHDDFKVRSMAQKELESLDRFGLTLLRDAYAKTKDPETKLRLEAIINKVEFSIGKP